MQLMASWYQLKLAYCVFKMFYVNLMVYQKNTYCTYTEDKEKELKHTNIKK